MPDQTFTLSIETDAGAYQHGFNLGTIERSARAVVEGYWGRLVPKIGKRIVTMALIREGRLFDVYDGSWANDRDDFVKPPFRTVSCGCCTDGCICHFHQDISRGIHATSCAYHAKHGHPHVTSPFAGEPA